MLEMYLHIIFIFLTSITLFEFIFTTLNIISIISHIFFIDLTIIINQMISEKYLYAIYSVYDTAVTVALLLSMFLKIRKLQNGPRTWYYLCWKTLYNMYFKWIMIDAMINGMDESFVSSWSVNRSKFHTDKI